MLRLLSDAENGKFSAVLCMAIDRLGRSSQKDGGIILETFKENGISIITPQKTYNLDDEFDETSVEMQSFLARQELKSIKRRLNAGIRKSLEEGYHITEAPFGYDRAYLNKRPTLEINNTEAEAVRMIFDMYVNKDMGCGKISDMLNTLGYTTKKGGFFSRNSVNFILQNPIYTGQIIWNRRHRIKKKTLFDKNRYIANPEDTWIKSEGAHPLIISDQLFEKAQQIRISRIHTPTRERSLSNPFAGIVFCRNCAGAVSRRSINSGKNIFMLCTKKGCTKSVGFEIFEKVITDCIITAMQNEIIVPEPEKKPDYDSQDAILTRLISELKSTEKQQQKIYELLEKGIYDDETFLSRSKALSEKSEMLRSRIAEEKKLSVPKNTSPPPPAGYRFPDLFSDVYHTMSPGDKNLLLKTLISRITYSHDSDQSRTEFTVVVEWNKNL